MIFLGPDPIERDTHPEAQESRPPYRSTTAVRAEAAYEPDDGRAGFNATEYRRANGLPPQTPEDDPWPEVGA